MKLKRLLTTVFALLVVNTMYADDCRSCDPCDTVCNTCDPCGGWRFEADWLYWKVRRSGLDYAVREIQTLPGKRYQCVKPDADSGIRLGVYKECENCWDIGVRYTSYDTSEQARVSIDENDFLSSRLHPTILSENDLLFKLAESKYKVDLDLIEVEFGYHVDVCCIDGYLRPFMGFEYTTIDQKLSSYYKSDADSVEVVFDLNEKIEMDAYGVYGGFEGGWELYCGFGLFGRTSYGLQVADFSVKYRMEEFIDGVPDDDINTRKTGCEIISVYEFATGIQYDLCDIKCVNLMLQLGYEYHHYCGMPDFLNFVDDRIPAKLERNGANLGYDGLMFRISASY